MRRVLLTLGALGALAACSAPQQSAPASSSVPPPASTAVQLPPEPKPTADGPCPYLQTSFVANANGQHVSKVRTSAEQPHPTCFFYSLSGQLQLIVRVYAGTDAVAKALVDQAAPVSSSNPATGPAGWTGGYEPTDSGAVYAVAKQGTAVVVTTNQKQTVKARTVAEQTISGLRL